MRPLRALAASLLVCATLAAPARAASDRCADTDLPVSLGPFPQTAHGRLCLPAGAAPGTVQLLVHGATYNSGYWDLPLHDGRYSYQRDLARRGVATFAVDGIGSGGSSQPPSALVTGTGQADVVHQVVGALRSGTVLGHRFRRVVLVGHSTGAAIAVVEAATHGDVAGVVLTGFGHSADLAAVSRVFGTDLRPALLDPVLSARRSDPGYLTTVPDARAALHGRGADPEVLAADEASKDQAAAAVVPELVRTAFRAPSSRRITVPVLLVNGQADPLFCAEHCGDRTYFLESEQPYFAPRTPLDAFLLPGAGHALGYAPDAAAYRTAVLNWMTAHFSG